MHDVGGGPISAAPEGKARTETARQLLESFYKMILDDGFFHADPHPGNLMWQPEEERLYLLDLGMVGEVTPADARADDAAADGVLAGGRRVPDRRHADADRRDRPQRPRRRRVQRRRRGADGEEPRRVPAGHQPRADPAGDDGDRRAARRAAAGLAHADGQGDGADAARDRPARPRARPVRGGRALRHAQRRGGGRRPARPEGALLPGAEAAVPREPADRGDRAAHRGAPGTEAGGQLPRGGARGDGPPSRTSARARRRRRRGAARPRRS